MARGERRESPQSSFYACILKAHSHSKSGGSIWASLECRCCFWIAGGLVSYLTMWLLIHQLFKCEFLFINQNHPAFHPVHVEKNVACLKPSAPDDQARDILWLHWPRADFLFKRRGGKVSGGVQAAPLSELWQGLGVRVKYFHTK
jgi:hypothetical protein